MSSPEVHKNKTEPIHELRWLAGCTITTQGSEHPEKNIANIILLTHTEVKEKVHRDRLNQRSKTVTKAGGKKR